MQQAQGAWSAIGAVVVAAGLGWYLFGGGVEEQARSDAQRVHSQVAADLVAQFGIAERNGSAMDRCIAASSVVAAYLQAQDEANYTKWKSVQETQCATAGVKP